MNKDTIIFSLTQLFGEKNILIDKDSKKIYGSDQTRNYIPDPVAIVFPTTELEVIELVKLANKNSFKLVPSGGRTGYSAGSVAAFGELVVSFEKMNNIIMFNEKDRTVKCESGVITRELQLFAEEKNLFYPVDFASSGSSHIGGNIATNAGGIKVIRYGLTRNSIIGLRVVTGNGDVLDLNHGLIKNACGYDLMQLFIGSEGTLGFITEATIKLIEKPLPSKVILMSVLDKRYLIEILNKFRSVRHVTAFEFFTKKAVEYVLKESSLNLPFLMSTPFYILIEYDSIRENDDIALKISEILIKDRLVKDIVFSENLEQARNIWRLRESISSSLRNYMPYKYDISVIPSKITAFMDDIEDILSDEKKLFEMIWFGHIGDGNLHLNILKPIQMEMEEFFKYCEHELCHKIYRIVQIYKGSISAEHGVGLLKKEFLSYSKSQIEISYMREIKKIFDKNNVMNPFKMV